MRKQMFYLWAFISLFVVCGLVWNVTARAGYESAQYEVVEKDGNIEIRLYPDLLLASTESKVDSRGRDGSFMRLFGYISGANETSQKIEMTTPVFMGKEVEDTTARMGFVIPQNVAAAGAPQPNKEDVSIRKREGGRFAVIRFSGRMDSKEAQKRETSLRKWMELKGIKGESTAETAGYDPPFTPGPLRRNEVLIRLVAQETLGEKSNTSLTK